MDTPDEVAVFMAGFVGSKLPKLRVPSVTVQALMTVASTDRFAVAAIAVPAIATIAAAAAIANSFFMLFFLLVVCCCAVGCECSRLSRIAVKRGKHPETKNVHLNCGDGRFIIRTSCGCTRA
jgi:hypothetical protein